jgi:hypothetical protein
MVAVLKYTTNANANPQTTMQRLRSTLVAAVVAVACVLLLQPLFVASLVFVKSHTDLGPVRRAIAHGFENGALSADEAPRSIIYRFGHQFTECVALQIAIDSEQDPLTIALVPKLSSPFINAEPCAELQDDISGHHDKERYDYGRYWHGYRLYLWPMLEYTELVPMRYVNGVLIFACIVALFLALRGTIGATPAAALMIVLLSLTDIWRIWANTPHFISTAWILGGSAMFAACYNRWPGLVTTVALAAVLGAVFNFIDFLINPPMMPMFLAFIVLAVRLGDAPALGRAETIDALWWAAAVALAWFGGYALTWITKWVLAAWISADDVRTGTTILNQILLRLYGHEPGEPVPIMPLRPTIKMIGQAFISAGSIVVAILAAAIFLNLRGHWASFDFRRFLLLSSPTLIPVFWFELLSSHTQTHSHFTYRSEAAAIAIVFAAALMAMPVKVTLKQLLGGLQRRGAA